MHIAPLIQDLAVILCLAAVVTYLFRLIKQPVVLGYVAAGIIVGPHTPSIFSVIDTENIKVWAELGVIFLMFSLGLEFSFRKLLKLGPSAAGTGLLQIAFMVVSGYFLAKAFGWSRFDSVFLGCMISISSTTIIIKALEELHLKSRKFAELAFGILIVEDLAAIIMMVGLTNFATQSLVEPTALLVSAARLLFIVSIWIILGMFILPRFVQRIAKKGNDEMLIVASLGFCLGLVTLASHLNYSVALGAFVMGSILSESGQVKRIEGLVMPLRDVFGAIFFVSVGMLLDPRVIIENFSHVMLVSIVIIAGKILSVFLGALLTGQSLRTSINTGFSMAQIGEFSFIIAALGQTLGVINKEIYPIIVAASLITTFTTPYLLRVSLPFADFCEAKCPARIRDILDSYRAWFQRRTTTTSDKKQVSLKIGRFFAHGTIILSLFILSSTLLVPWLSHHIKEDYLARLAGWIIAMGVATPFIWAMLNTFRSENPMRLLQKGRHPLQIDIAFLTAAAAIITFLSILSGEFFSGWISFGLFVIGFLAIVTLFRTKVKKISETLEQRFIEGLVPHGDEPNHDAFNAKAQKLIPWDAHLVPIEIPANSKLPGKTLLELQLRERYGINVIAINRGHTQLMAPGATEMIFPHDTLLCFASDKEIEQFKGDLLLSGKEEITESSQFELRELRLPAETTIRDKTVKESGIYTKFNCLVVGIERGGVRIKSPKSDEVVRGNDVLWVIGERSKLQKLIDAIIPAPVV